MAAVTTSQIAKELGLSRNTVSKALNNNPEVCNNTKRLVLATAKRLGYHRLNKQFYDEFSESEASYEICLIVHERELKVNFWNLILQGTEECLKVRSCRILFGILTYDDESNSRLPPVLNGNSISGIIAVGPYSDSYLNKIRNTGIPFVSIDTAASVQDHQICNDVILTSNFSSVYDITSELILKGARELAFVGDPYSCKSINERWKGFKAAINDNPAGSDEGFIAFTDIPLEFDYDKISKLVDSIERYPDAMVCANDIVANGIIKALEAKGKTVPGDVMVSGFDNYESPFIPISKLTTVSYDIKELGYLAARQILYRIERPESPCVIIRTAAKVIFRQSAR
ncbi:MAG: LacI family DNA-binding transcriptional regulator [Candidatus ainarchaeum sp.]|nr:LacI family DNA-binding transcriptional regulator [Candidatus ainarchaeum sp.]